MIRDHLMIVPVLLPMVTGAFLLLVDERRHGMKAALAVASTLALVIVAAMLVGVADAGLAPAGQSLTHTYLLGNWPTPFGIVLVLDRLSALMVLLSGILALAALVYALVRWDRAGPHFHSLFQFLLMGLNGAFLTGDLFNLFVFFEVLLAASYALTLHGIGVPRVRAGMHYIVVNLVASLFFLIGVSMIYGMTGTLNMADLARQVPLLADGDRAVMEAGAAVLGMAFLAKAAMWPLSFWLPAAYSSAAAPVAAVFAILSKVGAYALLRLSALVFGAEAGASQGFGGTFLVVGGIATIAFGAAGVLASQALGRLASYSVLVSSGTILAAIGMQDAGVTSGALFYLVSSTLAIGAFFLLIELVERIQDPAASVLAVTLEAYGETDDETDEMEEVGTLIPGTLAVLGICFALCGLLLAGLPPLSGFVGKFAMLAALIPASGPDSDVGLSTGALALAAMLILSGLATMIAMMRTGIRTFWAPIAGTVPAVRLLEIAPIGFLLGVGVVMTILGGPILRYTDAAAASLHAPSTYIGDVLSSPRVPPTAAKANP
ncbi:monovalent cation/H+ antiporter subunit D [Aureimonas glaciei]|uniref:Monovalent cation/H+ antiporter subunit D n=1 Tax=Aureimonas glaciei TaxID=1776957 RepID=A0A916Y8Q2_9HYPH|nr:monovalent cation/H+ antiporter subunit D [Aureimonas glaciei]GGD34991.1 monovalent cation/H+ antiporter subunit D [Aureimonas glaciei]